MIAGRGFAGMDELQQHKHDAVMSNAVILQCTGPQYVLRLGAAGYQIFASTRNNMLVGQGLSAASKAAIDSIPIPEGHSD